MSVFSADHVISRLSFSFQYYQTKMLKQMKSITMLALPIFQALPHFWVFVSWFQHFLMFSFTGPASWNKSSWQTMETYLWRKIIILFCKIKHGGIDFCDVLAEQSGNTRHAGVSLLLVKRAVSAKRCHLERALQPLMKITHEKLVPG